MGTKRVIDMTEEELRGVIREEAAAPNVDEDLRLRSAEEAAELVGMNRQTLLRLAKKGRVPHRVIGDKVIRFSRSDIAAIGEQRKAG